MDSGTQEIPHGFPICRTGNLVGERDFAEYSYIVPGRGRALSAIVSCVIFQVRMVAFLMDVKVDGNATRDGTMLTITVVHSSNMKSNAVVRGASLNRSKFLP